jgi:uncharacterized delta-60 repeat protein
MASPISAPRQWRAKNGKILIASGGDVRRLSTSGSLDTTYGSNGIAHGGVDIHDLDLQSDGKLIATGSTVFADENQGQVTGFGVERFNTNGTIDHSFGDNGLFAHTETPEDPDIANAAAIQADGRIVVVGTNADGDPHILRINKDGTLDTSFNVFGTAHYNVAFNTFLNDVKIQSDGRILVAGTAQQDQLEGDDMFVRRFNPDGTNDTSFPSPSLARFSYIPNDTFPDGLDDDALAMAIDSSGRIVVSGSVAGHLATARLQGGASQAVQLTGGDLSITGTSGNDTITVSPSGSNLIATLNGVSKTFATSSVKSISISGLAGNDSITVSSSIAIPTSADGGDGSDTITTGGGNDFLFGGAGNDTLRGQDGNDTFFGYDGDDQLEGGNGNDLMHGGAGNDKMFGQAGNDTMDGGLGADLFQGSGGIDLADYSARTDNLTISLDNVANDGAAGEGDSVQADVENIDGGSGNDKITANFLDNTINGNAGNDSIFGSSGNDSITGGPGADQLFGQDGNDTIQAKDDTRDSIDGGAGTDTAIRDVGLDLVSNVEVTNSV